MAEKVSELQVVVSADTTPLTKGLAEANASVTGFGSKLGAAAGLIAGGFAVAGAGIAAGLAVGIKSAADLEQAVANISTIKPEIDNSQVFASLNEMSTRIPQTAAALGESLYNVFSSVEVTQEQALRLTEQFGKGATAAQTDAQTFGTAVMGVMNAYGLSVDDATHVSDVFFNTVNKGVVTGQELASSLGPVTQSAKSAGVGLDELGAMIAAVTKEGGPAAQNINNLNNFLQKVTTKEAQTQIEALGVKTKTATGEFRPTTEVLTDLKARLGGMTEAARANALQAIFPDAQARLGAQVLMSQLDLVKTATEENRTASGVAEEAYRKMSETFNSQSTILVNSFKAIGTTIGGELLPYITPLVSQLSKDLPGAFAQVKAVGSDAFRQLSDAAGTVKQVFEGNWSADDSIEPIALAAGNAALALKDLSDWAQQVADKATQLGALDNVAAAMETINTETELAVAGLNEIVGSFDRLSVVLGGSATGMSGSAAALKLLAAGFELTTIAVGESVDIFLTFIRVGIDLAAGLAAVARGFYALANGDIPTFLKAGDLAEAAFRSAGEAALDFGTRSSERASQGFAAISTAATTEMPVATAAVTTATTAMQADLDAFEIGATATTNDLMVQMGTSVDQGMTGVSTSVSAGMVTAATSVSTNGAAMTTSMETAGTGMTTAAQTGMTGVVSAVQTNGPTAVTAAESMGTGMEAGVTASMPGMISAAEAGASGAVAAVQGQSGAAQSAGQSVGQAAGQGIQSGIMGMINSIANAAASVVSRALAAARANAHVNGIDDYDGERAAGGSVRAMGTYLVGEHGPELFTPGASGYITPNHRLTAPALAFSGASSGGGGYDTVEVRLMIGDQEAGRLFVTGYQVAVEERGFRPKGSL